MDKAEVGKDNIYFEMESKKGTEARTYDDGNGNSENPATKRASIETSAHETKKKRQPAKEPNTVAFRPMLLVAAAVVAVAFLTAVATLVLALTMMLSRNNLTASKDSTDVHGANLASKLKVMKENNSDLASELKEIKDSQSLMSAELENLRIRMNKIEGSISSANCNKSSTSSDTNQEKNAIELWLAIQTSSKRIDSLSALLPAVNASINEKLIDVQQEIVQLDRKVQMRIY